MDLNFIDRVYIHPESESSEVAERVMSRLSPDKVILSDSPPERRAGSLSPELFDQSKRQIYITPFRGSFFKRCPGARPGLACCNYFVLNLGLQCNMNCSYCYLQSFLNSPYLTIYSNLEDALKELKEMADAYPTLPYRVGTGETIDSLSLDPLTLYSRDLIHFFRDYPHWKVEFKTKSNFVDQFLDVPHAGNVVVSWSVNPQAIVESEEHGTASLKERLSAAEKCLAKGFLVAFHMDPMIWRPDWRDHYSELVDEICARFSPKDLLNISLGALRYQPEQRHIMRERFSFDSWVLRAETHKSADGKMRYDQSVRDEMFKFVLDRFKNNSKAWRVFLCMETPETWLASTESVPARNEDLKTMFKQLPQLS